MNRSTIFPGQARSRQRPCTWLIVALMLALVSVVLGVVAIGCAPAPAGAPARSPVVGAVSTTASVPGIVTTPAQIAPTESPAPALAITVQAGTSSEKQAQVATALVAGAPPVPTPVVAPSPAGASSPTPAGVTLTAAVITATPKTPAPILFVDEHPVVNANQDQPSRIEYRQRIGQDVLAKRADWRGFAGQKRLAALNGQLGPLGYRVAARDVQGSTAFDLSRTDGTLVKGRLVNIAPISSGQSPVAFGLLLLDDQSTWWLLSPGDRLARVDGDRTMWVRPAVLGGGLLWVDLGANDQATPGMTVKLRLHRGESVVYEFSAKEPTVQSPVMGLWSWHGGWVLEVQGEVLIAGKSLNRDVGYDEVFGWRLIGDEPFYFFRRGGEIGMSYAGKELPGRYAEVIHYKCCEPAMFNPQGNELMTWFHARRGESWYYIEAGLFGG